MAAPSTLYDEISRNNLKTWGLILLFPFLLGTLLSGILLLVLWNDPNRAELMRVFGRDVIVPIMGVAFVWTLISYFMGDKMMLGFAGAKPLTLENKDHKRVYRAVENIALAAGLPTPKVYLIDDDSLNAFATGHSPKSASIALTTGIIKRLEPLELDGVIAHEMGHIGNRDIRLNMIIITGIGVCAMLADVLLRMTYMSSGSRSDNRDSGQAKLVVLLLGFALMAFAALIAPLIHMAISRTREYAADATGAYITRNPAALASALKKISSDPRVEVLDKSPNMATACIYDPTEMKKASFFSFGGTHPAVKDRINRLLNMTGTLS